jgi:hypothetical protein
VFSVILVVKGSYLHRYLQTLPPISVDTVAFIGHVANVGVAWVEVVFDEGVTGQLIVEAGVGIVVSIKLGSQPASLGSSHVLFVGLKWFPAVHL